jgi:cell wall-associated NlpC family hydrolase
MDSNEQTKRNAIVAEARSWLKTPYRLGAHKRGIGCDCFTFIAEAMVGAGIADRGEVDAFYAEVAKRFRGAYRHDWFSNVKSEVYLELIMKFGKLAIETKCYGSSQAQPGDMVLVRCVRSKYYNHGGIVTEWPQIVHSIAPAVATADASLHPLWIRHEIAVFSPLAI